MSIAPVQDLLRSANKELETPKTSRRLLVGVAWSIFFCAIFLCVAAALWGNLSRQSTDCLQLVAPTQETLSTPTIWRLRRLVPQPPTTRPLLTEVRNDRSAYC